MTFKQLTVSVKEHYRRNLTGFLTRLWGGRPEETESFNNQEVDFSIAFFFPFLTMRTAVLRKFVHTVKVK